MDSQNSAAGVVLASKKRLHLSTLEFQRQFLQFAFDLGGNVLTFILKLDQSHEIFQRRLAGIRKIEGVL
jgi:hypothetical protein